MTLQELQLQDNVDPAIIRIWTERESDTLLPIQATAIRDFGILAGRDLLVSAPTSSGKTFLAEIAAIHTIYQRRNVVYLLPLKALAEEKYADFVEKYRDFGLDVVISTGDHLEFDNAIGRGEFQIAVIVFEKANRLLVRNKHFLANCGLIIVDEIQMTADYARGSSLELLLTALVTLRTQGRARGQNVPQFIALSAVIGDLNRLHEWLQADVLLSDQRPVELREGILRPDGTFTYRAVIAQTTGTEQFPPFPAQVSPPLKTFDARRESHYKRLQHYVAYLVAQGEQVLIFQKWKWLTRETALRLAQSLQLPPALDAIEALRDMEDSISKQVLIDALRHGAAFHNADLGRAERRALERAFRADDSRIRVLCATSTLAMGINLPVNTVIIQDLEKIDPAAAAFQEMPLSAAEYKNMSGRAGRLKHHAAGRSIIFAETPAEEGILWRNYIAGDFPRLTSQLAESALVSETLFLTAAELCASEEEIIEFLRHSYAGLLYWQTDARTAAAMVAKVQAALTYGLKHELLTMTPVDVTARRIQVTETGRICAMQGVSVETFVTVTQFFALFDPATCSDWELLFSAVHNRELNDVHVRLSQAAYESGEYWHALQELNPPHRELLLAESERLLQNRFEVTKRIKMSLLLLDWIAGLDLPQLEIKYSQFYRDKSYSGVIRQIAENASWMLRLLADVAAVRHGAQATVTRLQTLAQRVLYGIPTEGLELAALQVPGLTRAMVMRLAAAGYVTEEQVIDADLDDLLRVLPRELAFRLQDRLYKKYRRTETRHVLDHKLRLERLGYDGRLVTQVYAAATLTDFAAALMQLLQTPHVHCLIREIDASDASVAQRDFLLERADGVWLLRVFPPNLRDLSDSDLGNLLAAGMPYAPAAFALIGRPDFTDATRARVHQFTAAYGKPLHLLPAYDLCERCVQAIETGAPFALV